MKKIQIIWMMVLVCLSACTEDDNLSTNVSVDEASLYANTMNSNVPIRFAPIKIDASVEEIGLTRGSVSETTTVLDNLGLFCLAKYSLDGTYAPSWSGKAKKIVNDNSIWKKNENLRVELDEDNNRNIMWKTNEGYYPDNNYFAYGFVIYHPWTEYIVYTQKTITAYIKVDGNDDVLYGIAAGPKAMSGDNLLNRKGFSASYYDALDPDPGIDEYIYPDFTLEHLMCRIDFNFQLKEEPTFNIHVEKVYFDKVPCIMKLGLASRTSGTMKRSISPTPFVRNEDELLKDTVYTDKQNNKYTLPQLFPELFEGQETPSPYGHFELREESDEPISGQKNADGSYKYNLTTEPIHVGDCIMIPPMNNHHSCRNIQLNVIVADDAGNKYKCSTPVELKCPVNGWTKGKRYPFTIRLYPPVLSGNKGEISEWDARPEYNLNEELVGWTEVTQ